MTHDLRREIQGKIAALNKVITEARKTIRALESMLPPYVVIGEMEQITKKVAMEYGASLSAMKGPARHRAIFLARAEAMRRIRQTDRYTLQQIGRYFGGRDHSSVMVAIRRAENILQGRDQSSRD